MNFYKLKEAAAAIAAELYPADVTDDSYDPRADVERCYLAALQHAVCENEIVYRDPGTRLPVRRTGIEASLAARSCIVSQHDLNVWLQGKGVGIQIHSPSSSETYADDSSASAESGDASTPLDTTESERPTSAQLAAALGPYLTEGRDKETLKDMFHDVRGRPKLARYRKMSRLGARNIATWEVAGVVLHLITERYMTWECAKDALTEHYPQHLDILDGLGPQEEAAAATWIPRGIG
ncbi:hypothetical protein [Burkholderia stagnalis]|uniref:hypothetical protein n=1 Tax=Burkholderia stagnalis TaxID=1503054 RepID=UPI000754AE50|nr:hypothetical protein [Burkholderia stagnalis]KVN24159.1 hypothetical protein WT10_00420 [Burkholderia stagnalis]KWK59456.1 hypothetical protein WT82_31735 [Burkholderia stagnalis]